MSGNDQYLEFFVVSNSFEILLGYNKTLYLEHFDTWSIFLPVHLEFWHDES